MSKIKTNGRKIHGSDIGAGVLCAGLAFYGAVQLDKSHEIFNGYLWDSIQGSPENGGVETLYTSGPVRRDVACAVFDDGGVELVEDGKIQDALSVEFSEVRLPSTLTTAAGSCIITTVDPQTGAEQKFITDAFPASHVVNFQMN